MWCKNIAGRFLELVTKHACDRRTDRITTPKTALAQLRRAVKRKKDKDKPNSGKLGIRRDHPRRRIEMKFCVVGRLQMVVLRFELHQNRISGFGAVGSKFAHPH